MGSDIVREQHHLRSAKHGREMDASTALLSLPSAIHPTHLPFVVQQRRASTAACQAHEGLGAHDKSSLRGCASGLHSRFVMNAVILWMLVMQLGQEVPAGNPQVILVQDIVSKEACERLGQTMLQRLKMANTIAFCAPVEKSQPK